MRTLSILLLCVIGSALVSLTVANNGRGPERCCFTYYTRKVQFTKLRTYYVTDDRCPMVGVILTTVASPPVHICVNPNTPWVQSIMKRLDQKNL